MIIPKSAALLLAFLRSLMVRENIGALIVPMQDEHYVSEVKNKNNIT